MQKVQPLALLEMPLALFVQYSLQAMTGQRAALLTCGPCLSAATQVRELCRLLEMN